MTSRKREYNETVSNNPPETDTTAQTERQIKKSRVTRTCVVCDVDQYSFGFPSSKRVASHGHGLNTCRACYRMHLENEINTKLWDQVSCPECEAVLEYHEVKNMGISEDHSVKYEEGSLKAALASDPDYRTCFSPTCKSGQLHPNKEDEPIFRCQDCGHKHCVICEVPWHEDETCEDYKTRILLARGDENEQSDKIVQKISKPCPSCHSRIEKFHGCDHMTCESDTSQRVVTVSFTDSLLTGSRCRTEFCWICLANYRDIFRDGNHGHEKSCKWYRPAVERHPPETHAPQYGAFHRDPPPRPHNATPVAPVAQMVPQPRPEDN